MDLDGIRIRGDEADANGECHRARYRWAATQIPSGSSVLDYGCGTGYGTGILCDGGHRGCGYDVDEAAVAIARERHCVQAATSYSGRFGAVVCFEVIEHLADDPMTTLLRLRKIAPLVIASVPYLERPGNPHHRWFGLSESTFPGCSFFYQKADGSISTASKKAQNLLIVSKA